MRRHNTGFWFLLASALAAYAIVVSGADRVTERSARPVALTVHDAPKPAPTLLYMDFKGEQEVKPEAARLTIVHFWATWCPPCGPELKELDRIATRLAERKVAVIPLVVDGADAQKIRKFYAEHGIEVLPFAYDQRGLSMRALNASVLPTTVFLDAKGREIARSTGVADWKNFIATDLPRLVGAK